MDKEDRQLAIEIMSEMMQVAKRKFDEKGLDNYLKFKIVCREQRMGDDSLGEEIVVDEIKEYLNNGEKSKGDNTQEMEE